MIERALGQEVWEPEQDRGGNRAAEWAGSEAGRVGRRWLRQERRDKAAEGRSGTQRGRTDARVSKSRGGQQS